MEKSMMMICNQSTKRSKHKKIWEEEVAIWWRRRFPLSFLIRKFFFFCFWKLTILHHHQLLLPFVLANVLPSNRAWVHRNEPNIVDPRRSLHHQIPPCLCYFPFLLLLVFSFSFSLSSNWEAKATKKESMSIFFQDVARLPKIHTHAKYQSIIKKPWRR